MRAPAYRTLNYERNDRTRQTNRPDDGWKIDIGPLVAAIDAQLFCARKEVAIHHRSRALRRDRRDLSLADLRGSGCAGEISLGNRPLTGLFLRRLLERRFLDDVVHLRLPKSVLVLKHTAAGEKQRDDCNRDENPFH